MRRLAIVPLALTLSACSMLSMIAGAEQRQREDAEGRAAHGWLVLQNDAGEELCGIYFKSEAQRREDVRRYWQNDGFGSSLLPQEQLVAGGDLRIGIEHGVPYDLLVVTCSGRQLQRSGAVFDRESTDLAVSELEPLR